MPEKSLEGKVTIITGAGSSIGLGHAMAASLVRAGARVAMLDIDASSLEESVGDIRAIGGEDCALPIVADITVPDGVTEAVEKSIRGLGGLHILINNAGVWVPQSFRDVSIETWNRVRAVNLDGAFYMARAVVGHMTTQGWGRIIGVTTSLGSMWSEGGTTYGTSKAGHEALVSVMARELHGTGVTANVLVPGGNTYTNMTAHVLTGESPPAEMIQADVMQAPIRWLASDASGDFTGRRIVAYHWDESLLLDARLEKASAPAAWPQLGGIAIEL